MKFLSPALGPVLALCLSLPAAAQTEAARTIIVLDGSGSMWGQIDGRPKLEIAREVLGRVLAGIAADRELGLMAYGHRRRGDCTDIELVVPPAPGTSGAITQAANAMRFQGRTPLTEAVRQAARDLNFTENPATVVLITDGIETCEADPCALARELEAAGIDFTAHVVGFGLTAQEGAQVACLAQETGGQYLLADNAADLASALAATVAQAPDQPAPRPMAAPEPVPASPLPPARLRAPAEVTVLQGFEVIIEDGPMGQADYIDIAWEGQTRVGSSRSWVRVADGNPARMTAPAEPGDYVLRYIEVVDGGPERVLAQVPLSVGMADYAMLAPDSAMAGAQIEVIWQAPLNPRDWIDVAPRGEANPDAYLSWTTVPEDGSPLMLLLPLDPGEYDLRFVAVGPDGPRVQTARPITVTPIEATLSGPDRVEAGAEVRVGWTGPFAPTHWVAMAPPEADAQSYDLGYFYLEAPGVPGTLSAPEATGTYELRLVLDVGGARIAARRPLEVVAPGTLGEAKD